MAAIALGYETIKVFNLQTGPNQNFLAFLFFSTALEYNLHKIQGIRSQFPWLVLNTNTLIKRDVRIYLLLLLLSSFTTIIFLFQLKAETLIVCTPFFVLTLFYSFPLFGKRLRELPGLKIFLIAICWSSLTTLPLFTEAQVELNSAVIIYLIQKLLFVFAITIPFDIRDIKEDEFGNIITLPGKIGVKQSKALAQILCLTAIALCICNPIMRFALKTAFAGSLLLSMVLLRSETFYQHKLFYTGVLDGLMILQPLAVLLASQM